MLQTKLEEDFKLKMLDKGSDLIPNLGATRFFHKVQKPSKPPPEYYRAMWLPILL